MIILSVLKFSWDSGGVHWFKRSKCDQAIQCLKWHGAKQHSTYWFLKQHSPQMWWICHLIPSNAGNTILASTKTTFIYSESVMYRTFLLYQSRSALVHLFKWHSLDFGVWFYFLQHFSFLFFAVTIFLA